MKSNMNHSFSQVPQANIQRSSFNRSSTLKTTFDVDELVPIYVEEILPGDTHTMKANLFGRLATPINPIMDNMYLDTFFFFVPTRLLWDNFQKFMGEQDSPGDSTDYTIPTRTTTFSEGGLGDYLGLPTGISTVHNNLPMRAYHLIWDQWFRDQNLQDGAGVLKEDGNGILSPTTFNDTVRKRGKRHDYFTSCLTAPQKGAAVTLPLGTSAPISGLGVSSGSYSTSDQSVLDTADGSVTYSENFSTLYVDSQLTGPNTPLIYADLTQATAATINDLRTASQVQRLMETDARSGTRYTEKLKAHFGVTSPDFRLQRSEYLGGGTSPINITPIAQQSSTDGTTPQGNLAAMGTVSGGGHGFTKSFTEHGYIIGIANVRADLTYQQGVDRMWSRSTLYDFYFPGLAQIGEQAVLNQEIYTSSNITQNESVFGYQEAFSDYRYKNSKITGAFRSNAAAPLDSWHLCEEFGSLPGLNATFIESTTPLDRCIAVPAEPHFILDIFFKLTSVRPMPVHGIPGIAKF